MNHDHEQRNRRARQPAGLPTAPNLWEAAQALSEVSDLAPEITTAVAAAALELLELRLHVHQNRRRLDELERGRIRITARGQNGRPGRRQEQAGAP